jgi:hypothetical protein
MCRRTATRRLGHVAINTLGNKLNGGVPMAIVAVFEFPTDSVEKYEAVFDIGGSSITDQPSRLSHLCYRTENGFTVVDTYTDEASFAAFGEILGPVAAQAGLDAKPLVYPVQQMVSHDGTRTR